MAKTYEDDVVERIEHVKSHLDVGFKIDQLVNNIENGLGNPRACVMSLSMHAEGKAMYAWFSQKDLACMKNWCYVGARLDQMWNEMQVDTLGPRSKVYQLLKPLLSDETAIIDWFAGYDAMFDLGDVDNHKTVDFWTYQAIVALRGDWERLASRCEKVLSDPPAQKSEKKFLIDHEFYLALAHKDVRKMEEILSQMVTPKAVRARSNDESGFTEGMISTAAVIYAKIAWRNGLRVSVNSPYIPKEWLPVEPLSSYDYKYKFLGADSKPSGV